MLYADAKDLLTNFINQSINHMTLLRAVTAWARSMCGPLEMAERMTTATAMGMRPQCGLFR